MVFRSGPQDMTSSLGRNRARSAAPVTTWLDTLMDMLTVSLLGVVTSNPHVVMLGMELRDRIQKAGRGR